MTMRRQDLIHKLFDPSIVKRYEMTRDDSGDTRRISAAEGKGRSRQQEEQTTITHNHHQQQQQTHDTTNERGGTFHFSLNPAAAMALTVTKQTATSMAASKSTRTPPVPISRAVQYPSWNYLTLRHKQNTTWAESQFELGVSLAKSALVVDDDPSSENRHRQQKELMQKAEECYKKGLDMIPHHSRILTAYGALCINDGRLELAQELLQRAIRYIQQEEEEEQVGEKEEDHDDDKDRLGTLNDAKTYLAVVESKLHAKNTRQLLLDRSTSNGGGKQCVEFSNKAQQAMKDVLAERAFVSGEESRRSKKVMGRNKTCGDYDLLSLSDSSSREDKNNHDDDGKNDASCTEKYHSHYDSTTSKRRTRHFETHKRRKEDKRKKKHKEQHRRKKQRRTSRNYESSSSSDENDDVDQSSMCSQSSDDTDYYRRKRRRSRRKHHKKSKKNRR